VTTPRVAPLSGIGAPVVVRRPEDAGPGFARALDGLLEAPKAAPGEAEVPIGDGLRLSRHAEARLSSRGVVLDGPERESLDRAVSELERKGAKKSLILTRDNAWIVGITKKTVITVLSREEALHQVFTDLDSMVVAD
jgi:flagellar operon protein